MNKRVLNDRDILSTLQKIVADCKTFISIKVEGFRNIESHRC